MQSWNIIIEVSGKIKGRKYLNQFNVKKITRFRIKPKKRYSKPDIKANRSWLGINSIKKLNRIDKRRDS